MEETFRVRREELKQECRVSSTMFARLSDQLYQFMQPFVKVFVRHEQACHAAMSVQCLCSYLECKNAESIAYFFGQDRKSIQHFIGESRWDDQGIRHELARQIGQSLGQEDGVLVFDPSAFPKKGDQSVGVTRQWCGRLGKLENCQVGVYLAYVSGQGHALVDTELFLPKEWTQDRWRMKSAGVPKARRKHRTRHQLCLALLE